MNNDLFCERGIIPYGQQKGIRPEHSGRLESIPDRLNAAGDIRDMADTLGVSRKTLSEIINEGGAITPDMALRLSRAFDTTPDLRLNLQVNCDLWIAENTSKEWQKSSLSHKKHFVAIHRVQSNKPFNQADM